jgi:hypothetical protein
VLRPGAYLGLNGLRSRPQVPRERYWQEAPVSVNPVELQLNRWFPVPQISPPQATEAVVPSKL